MMSSTMMRGPASINFSASGIGQGFQISKMRYTTRAVNQDGKNRGIKQAIKKTALDSHTMEWPDAFKLEMEQSAIVMMSKDAREGPRAFKEKRKPEFSGE